MNSLTRLDQPSTIWVDRWFASSAGTFLDLIRAEFPDARLIYTHRAPDHRAMAAADTCSREVPRSVDEIVAFAAAHDVDVLFPARSVDLSARASARLAAQGTVVALPTTDLGALDAMHDKQLTYQVCDDHGLARTPQWRVATTGAELHAAVAEWSSRGAVCCIKPTIGEGAAGFRVIDPAWNPADSLLEWPSATLTPRELERLVTGLTLPLPPMLVSDYLPGDESSLDVASRDGEVIACVVRRKQSASTQVIERDALAESVVAALSAHWSLTGCWNAQFKLDRDGTARLLEVNPRPAVGSLYAASIGANFPALAVALAWGADVRRIESPDAYLIHRHQSSEIVRAPLPSNVALAG